MDTTGHWIVHVRASLTVWLISEPLLRRCERAVEVAALACRVYEGRENGYNTATTDQVSLVSQNVTEGKVRHVG